MILLLAAILANAAPLGEIAFMKDAKVWLVREDGTGRRELAQGSYDRPIVWSPDGSRLLFWKENPSWQLIQIDLASGKATDLTRNRYQDCRAASYSPDGKQIAFMSGEKGLCLMNADGSELQNLSSRGHRDARPHWAANGDIFFQSIDNGAYSVLRYDRRTGLTSTVVEATEYAVSGDGKRLAYRPRGAGAGDLVIRDLESNKTLDTLRQGNRYEALRWSPAGDAVMAVSYAPTFALWRITPGHGVAKWTDLVFGAWVGFDFSSDGQKVVYSNGKRPDESIYVLDRSGGKPRKIADGVWPIWRPRP